jgi:23S rRNA (guanine745-N1)-methyltransferase
MNALSCPLCRLPLTLNTQGVACERGHQFDRAKEGYFNLLPVQYKHSLEPGDAKQQLDARRQFLQAGFFAPLKIQLQKLLPGAAKNLLDIGCGEGYFTNSFAEALPEAHIYGVDIAKPGVRLAAKAAGAKGLGGHLTYAVASSFDLPLADGSIDVITRIYAPSKDAELCRVMGTAGLLVIVAPGEQHLLGLRRRIYREVRPHQQTPVPEGFRLADEQRVTADLVIELPAMRAALLAMTPFAWRINQQLKADLIDNLFEDRLDFSILIYNKI